MVLSLWSIRLLSSAAPITVVMVNSASSPSVTVGADVGAPPVRGAGGTRATAAEARLAWHPDTAPSKGSWSGAFVHMHAYLAALILTLLSRQAQAPHVTFTVDVGSTDLGVFPATVVTFAPSWNVWALPLAPIDMVTRSRSGTIELAPNTSVHYLLVVTGQGDGWSGSPHPLRTLPPPDDCAVDGAYAVSVGDEDMNVSVCAGACTSKCDVPPLAMLNESEQNASIPCERWHEWARGRVRMRHAAEEDFCFNATAAWTACESHGASHGSGVAQGITAHDESGVLSALRARTAWANVIISENVVRPLELSAMEAAMWLPNASRPHPAPPQFYRTAGPYPTNAWWATLGIGDGTASFTSLPYTLESSPAGLSACAPTSHVAPHEALLSCQGGAMLTFGMELAAAAELRHEIVRFDDLSVTIQYHPQSGCDSIGFPCPVVTMPLLHGMPYVSA